MLKDFLEMQQHAIGWHTIYEGNPWVPKTRQHWQVCMIWLRHFDGGENLERPPFSTSKCMTREFDTHCLVLTTLTR